MDKIIPLNSAKNAESKSKTESVLTPEQIQLQAQMLFQQVVTAYASPIQRFDNGELFRQFFEFMEHHKLAMTIVQRET